MNNSRLTTVVGTDPFLTADAGEEFCSLLSSREDNLPNYFSHYQSFIDNVSDIPDDVMDDINKTHREREVQFKDAEKKEEARLAQKREAEQKLKRQSDRQIKSLMNQYTIYVKRSCPVKIPFKSTLNSSEHKFYIMAFMKFRNHPPRTSLEHEEYQQYLSMQNRVFNEQSCLVNFSYKVSQMVLKDYNAVPSFVDDHIKSYFSHKSERISSYPDLYKCELEIPLKPQLPKEAVAPTFQLTHLGHLLSLGWVPALSLSFLKSQVLLADENSLAKVKSPATDNDFDSKSRLYKCPVSEDPNAEFLAMKHNADIVMSAGAFKTLADNQEQPFDKEWYLPVTVKSYDKTDDSTKDKKSSRIIFIDKALPRLKWLPLQKKHTFFKASVLGHMTKQVQARVFRMQGPIRSKPENIEVPSWLDSLHDTDAETFTCESPPILSPSLKRSRRSISRSPDLVDSDLRLTDDDDEESSSGVKWPSWSNDAIPPSSTQITTDRTANPASSLPASASKPVTSPTSNFIPPTSSASLSPPVRTSIQPTEDHEGFLDHLLLEQDSLLKPQSSLQDIDRDASSVNTSVVSQSRKEKKERLVFREHFPWSNSLTTDWGDFKVKRCPESGGVNYHYQLFLMEGSSTAPAMEDRKAPLRILVRHKVHGLSTLGEEQRKQEKKDERKAFVLFPKVENQVFFGCEVNSLSEIVQQWASLVVRPNTSLLQVRICASSGAIVMADKKTLETVLKEGSQSHVNFRPQSVLFSLEVIFRSLMSVASGRYVLHHSAKTEAFVKLFKEINSNSDIRHGSLNLHDVYNEEFPVSQLYTTAPWLAIDTHVLTPFHLRHRKIPATFPMDYGKKLTKADRKKIRKKCMNKLSIENFE